MTSWHFIIFLCVFFFVFFSRTDRFFNLSCHLFSYPLSLKQTSSFTKIIFLLDFLKKIKKGKKSFLLALSLCRSRQILGYVCRSIKGSQLTPHVQVRLTCLSFKIHVFLFNQISCLQSVVCEYSIIFIYLHVSLCKSPCSDVFSGVFLLQISKSIRMRERERERVSIYIYIGLIYIYIYIYIYIFKQLCDIIALVFFLCVFFFVFSSGTDRFFNLSCRLFSYPLSLKQTSSFTKTNSFFGFSQKKRRRKKSFVPSLILCRSRQILGYVCRPIKGSQLTPYVQVRLTCLPSNIHVFLFKQISCLQGVVCEYIPSYYVFFFTMCDLSPLNFPALKML